MNKPPATKTESAPALPHREWLAGELVLHDPRRKHLSGPGTEELALADTIIANMRLARLTPPASAPMGDASALAEHIIAAWDALPKDDPRDYVEQLTPIIAGALQARDADRDAAAKLAQDVADQAVCWDMMAVEEQRDCMKSVLALPAAIRALKLREVSPSKSDTTG